MEHRTTASRQRSLVILLTSLLVLAGCTRGEPAAQPPGDARPSDTNNTSAQTAGPKTQTAVGFDSVATQRQPGFICYAGARYVVVARNQEVGSDLYVRARGEPNAAPRCDADSIAGDMVFRTGEAASRHPDAQHFMGLKGDLLVAWDGTGGASDLYVYDLTRRSKALMVEDVDENNLEWLSPTTVAVWVGKAYGERAAAAGCPDTMPANPATLDSLMSLDFQTLALRPTGRFRCAVGQ